jgi:ribonuclease P/MRP protein subunit POP5
VREKEKRKVILLEQKLQMAKAKIKPLLPSLREKKRYLAYEVISKHRFNDAVHVNKAILDAANDFLGDLGMAKAGILPINDKWNADSQRGIMRVNNKHVDELKASLIFVKNINGKGAFVKSVGASGILRKAQQKYLNQAS